MRRSDQFPFRHFDRPKPPARCRPILVTGANYSSGRLTLSTYCRQMTAICAHGTAGVDVERSLLIAAMASPSGLRKTRSAASASRARATPFAAAGAIPEVMYTVIRLCDASIRGDESSRGPCRHISVGQKHLIWRGAVRPDLASSIDSPGHRGPLQGLDKLFADEMIGPRVLAGDEFAILYQVRLEGGLGGDHIAVCGSQRVGRMLIPTTTSSISSTR
jgi:hypothetical protein